MQEKTIMTKEKMMLLAKLINFNKGLQSVHSAVSRDNLGATSDLETFSNYTQVLDTFNNCFFVVVRLRKYQRVQNSSENETMLYKLN